MTHARLKIFRRLSSGAVLALIVGAAFTACDSAGSESAANGTNQGGDGASLPGITPRAVQTMEVVEGVLGGWIRVSGLVSGTREADVISETQGRILAVEFDLGDSVEEGRALVRFDDTLEQLALAQAREQREAARLDVEALERQAERGTVSLSQLTNARAGLRGAEQAFEQARRAYENRTIRAPISGRIAARDSVVGEGGFLTQGARVARVVDTTELRLSGSVGEREVRFIREGQTARVNVTAWGAIEPIPATVVAVAAGSDDQTGSFPVALEWENCCGDVVRSGMSASAVIDTAESAVGLLVPTASLRRVGDTDTVFVAENGSVEQREVTVLERFGARAIVSEGVVRGDEVVISAVSRLRDGDPVAAERVGTTEEAQ